MKTLNKEQERLLENIKKDINIENFRNYVFNYIVNDYFSSNEKFLNNFIERKNIIEKSEAMTDEIFSNINMISLMLDFNNYCLELLQKIELIKTITIDNFGLNHSLLIRFEIDNDHNLNTSVDTSQIIINEDNFSLKFSSSFINFNFDSLSDFLSVKNKDSALEKESNFYKLSKSHSLDSILKPTSSHNTNKNNDYLEKHEICKQYFNNDFLNNRNTDLYLYHSVLIMKSDFLQNFSCNIPFKNNFGLNLNNIKNNLNSIKKIYKKAKLQKIELKHLFLDGPLYESLHKKKLNIDLHDDIVSSLELLSIEKDINIEIHNKKEKLYIKNINNLL